MTDLEATLFEKFKPLQQYQLNQIKRKKYLLILNVEISGQRLHEVFSKLTNLPVHSTDVAFFYTEEQLTLLAKEANKKKDNRKYLPTWNWMLFDPEKIGSINKKMIFKYDDYLSEFFWNDDLNDNPKLYCLNKEVIHNSKRNETMPDQVPLNYSRFKKKISRQNFRNGLLTLNNTKVAF